MIKFYPSVQRKSSSSRRQGVLLLFVLLASCFVAPVIMAQDAIYDYKVVKRFPHNIESFTQGLVFHEGALYEGTGKKGRSTLRKIDLETGDVQLSKSLPARYFGEGIEVVGDKIYQLSWQSHIVFVYDKHNFEVLGNHYNATEGWGLAFDGELLVLSDGTANLQFIEPETFKVVRQVQVMYADVPVPNLNELEFINGEIWANVWQTDYIVRIDPATGHVNSLVDLTGLSEQTQLGSSEAVLNGVAWDKEKERLFVTGKYWSDLFQIELVGR